MIAFDNGPARGDYVRYIDELMARAALAVPAVVQSDGDMANGVDALIREQSKAASRSSEAAEWIPTAPSARRRTPGTTTSGGFATPTVASPAAAAAAALASALMSGQVGPRAALSAGTLIALAAVVGGVLLVLVGLFLQPFNLAIVVGGGALIAWALRRMGAAGRGAGRTRSA